MKRLIFMVMAVMVMAAPVANAQNIDRDAELAKLKKADATLQDAKKAAKSATWINHGKVYYEAANLPTADLYTGADYEQTYVNIGDPESKKDGVVLAGEKYTEMVYPWFKLYVTNGKIATWSQTMTLRNDDLAAVALESYTKAAEMDPKAIARLKDPVKKLEDFYSKAGNAFTMTGEYIQAAYNYTMAYKVQEHPAYEGDKKADYLYYAGYFYVADGANNPESYDKAIENLSKAIDAGYVDEKGDIYYYLFMSYYNNANESVKMANMDKCKKLLMEGLAKFPNNDNIIEGLINVYTAGAGDPKELIEVVDGALKRDPKNKGLWYGRGRIFYSLKDYDQSIESFKKVVELDPKDAQSLYYVGYFYVLKADGLNNEFNQRDYKSNDEFKADQAKITAVYKEAIPYLEKSYEANPKDVRTLEVLKSLTFRLREEDGIQAKFDKYNKLFNEAKK
ncbi:MAG: tetratricopeptide repeat protein [Alistipes sp.]|nr:tetratricopeptide repeat protein [Alistipes sp.]